MRVRWSRHDPLVRPDPPSLSPPPSGSPRGRGDAAPLHLVRVVVVTRHGVRPPTQTNADLAKYSDQPWPDWPVEPGDLTPHGGETVRLMGETVRAAYRAQLCCRAPAAPGPDR